MIFYTGKNHCKHATKRPILNYAKGSLGKNKEEKKRRNKASLAPSDIWHLPVITLIQRDGVDWHFKWKGKEVSHSRKPFLITGATRVLQIHQEHFSSGTDAFLQSAAVNPPDYQTMKISRWHLNVSRSAIRKATGVWMMKKPYEGMSQEEAEDGQVFSAIKHSAGQRLCKCQDYCTLL